MELVDSAYREMKLGLSEPEALGRSGWVEVIAGSMFSGKTEELLRRMRRALIAKQPSLLIKPKIDTRYSETHVVSHNQLRAPSASVERSDQILKMAEQARVIGIDEAQFFDRGLIQVCEKLADEGKRVIVAGLDRDYRGLPFGPMPELLALAEVVTKLTAVCTRCGRSATRTQRLSSDGHQVLLGAQDVYEARCRSCYEPPKFERET